MLIELLAPAATEPVSTKKAAEQGFAEELIVAEQSGAPPGEPPGEAIEPNLEAGLNEPIAQSPKPDPGIPIPQINPMLLAAFGVAAPALQASSKGFEFPGEFSAPPIALTPASTPMPETEFQPRPGEFQLPEADLEATIAINGSRHEVPRQQLIEPKAAAEIGLKELTQSESLAPKTSLEIVPATAEIGFRDEPRATHVPAEGKQEPRPGIATKGSDPVQLDHIKPSEQEVAVAPKGKSEVPPAADLESNELNVAPAGPGRQAAQPAEQIERRSPGLRAAVIEAEAPVQFAQPKVAKSVPETEQNFTEETDPKLEVSAGKTPEAMPIRTNRILDVGSSSPLEPAPRHRVLNEVAGILQELADRQSAKSVVLLLEPADLGSIEIQIGRSPEGIEAKLSASHPEIRVALTSGKPQIEEHLTAKGINLSSFEVAAQTGGFLGGGDRGLHPSPEDAQRLTNMARTASTFAVSHGPIATRFRTTGVDLLI